MKKVVFVSGGSNGIGKQLVTDFIKEGYHVGFNYRHYNEHIDELISLGKQYHVSVDAYQCDVSDYQAVAQMMKTFIAKHGQIDVLVNNAGITKDTLLMRMSEADFKSVVDINLGGAFNLCKQVAPQMMRQKSGNIINMSSVVGIFGNIGQANYASSKAGMIGLTKSLAKELGRWNIRCNAIAPGFIDTAMTQKLSPEQVANIKRQISLNRLGTIQEVSDLVMFLASDKSRYISGSVINIDGGM